MILQKEALIIEYEYSIKSSTSTFYIASQGEAKYFLLRKPRDDNDKYFRFEAEARSAIYQCQYLRKYIQMLDPGSSQMNSYIFQYIEGITVEERIKNMMIENKSIPFQEIQRYMWQLMNALYVLHSNNILGRVFTTSNILITNNLQNIVLMDFGFLSSNKIPIAAPEVGLPQPIDLKSDVWLFGAFLFHLIKYKSIRQISSININTFQFDQQGGEVQSCGTDRYDSEFCSLVDKMLKTNKNQRISFYEILQTRYFQQCPKLNEMKEFYRKSVQIDQRISKNMEPNFDEFDTGQLEQPEEQYQLQVRISSEINQFLPPVNQEQLQNISPTIGPQSRIFAPQHLSEVDDCSNSQIQLSNISDCIQKIYQFLYILDIGLENEYIEQDKHKQLYNLLTKKLLKAENIFNPSEEERQLCKINNSQCLTHEQYLELLKELLTEEFQLNLDKKSLIIKNKIRLQDADLEELIKLILTLSLKNLKIVLNSECCKYCFQDKANKNININIKLKIDELKEISAKVPEFPKVPKIPRATRN